MKNIIFSILTLILWAYASQIYTFSVQGTLSNLSGKFKVYVALFNNENAWLKDDKKYKGLIFNSKQVKNKKLSFKLTDIPKGTYALAVYEDVDANEKLNKTMFGPVEPFGFFRNYDPSFGPPDFQDVSFQLNANLSKANIPLLNSYNDDDEKIR